MLDTQYALYAGAILILVNLGLNRFLGEKNIRQLSVEQKGKLTEEFSSQRSLGTYLPIVLVIAMMLFNTYVPGYEMFVFPIVILLVLIATFYIQMRVLKRLGRMDLPQGFVQKFRSQSYLIQGINVVALILRGIGVAF